MAIGDPEKSSSNFNLPLLWREHSRCHSYSFKICDFTELLKVKYLLKPVHILSRPTFF